MPLSGLFFREGIFGGADTGDDRRHRLFVDVEPEHVGSRVVTYGKKPIYTSHFITGSEAE